MLTCNKNTLLKYAFVVRMLSYFKKSLGFEQTGKDNREEEQKPFAFSDAISLHNGPNSLYCKNKINMT